MSPTIYGLGIKRPPHKEYGRLRRFVILWFCGDFGENADRRKLEIEEGERGGVKK